MKRVLMSLGRLLDSKVIVIILAVAIGVGSALAMKPYLACFNPALRPHSTGFKVKYVLPPSPAHSSVETGRTGE